MPVKLLLRCSSATFIHQFFLGTNPRSTALNLSKKKTIPSKLSNSLSLVRSRVISHSQIHKHSPIAQLNPFLTQEKQFPNLLNQPTKLLRFTQLNERQFLHQNFQNLPWNSQNPHTLEQKKEQEAIEFYLPQEPLKPMETFGGKKKHTHTHTHSTTLLRSTPLQLQKQNENPKKNSQEWQAKQKPTKIRRRDRDRGELWAGEKETLPLVQQEKREFVLSFKLTSCLCLFSSTPSAPAPHSALPFGSTCHVVASKLLP